MARDLQPHARRGYWGQVLPPALTLVGLAIVWQVLTPNDSAYRVLPGPLQIGAALVRDLGLLLTDYVPITLLETGIGLALSLVLGVVLATLLDLVAPIRRALYPILIISQTIPLFALAPVLILLLGFGIEPKITIVVLFCTFPIAINALDGLMATPPEYEMLLRSLGAGAVARWRLARLPSALPSLFGGLRIATTYSVTGAIIGEYISPTAGVGKYMRSAYQTFKTEEALGAGIVVIVLSLLIVGLTALVERQMLGWYFARARGRFIDESP
jgi:ABC-type nitrate/sulfonate/bicarbonate transport system permease component